MPPVRDNSESLREVEAASFDIAPRKSDWDAETDEWVAFDPPERPAHLYVFCLHEPVPATNQNVLDPGCWRFWVISTQTLNERLGSQETVGLGRLNRLTEPLGGYGGPNRKPPSTNPST